MDILLVPGFMLDDDLWTDIRGELSRFGELRDVDTGRDASIEAIADRAVAELSGPSIVVGFSMGGYVARQIAYRAPEKVGALALIATSSRGDAARLAAQRSAASGRARSFQRLSRAAVASALSPAHRTDALIERVQRMSERLGGTVLDNQSRIRRGDDTDRLGEIACPTLVVAAADDELRTIEESEVLHRGIAGSSLAVIEGSGHLVPIEQPDALMRVLGPFVEASSR